MKLLTPMIVNFDSNYVYISFQGDETLAYTVERNKFETATGLTVSNISSPVPVYLIALSNEAESASYPNALVGTSGTTLSCGSVINNLFLALKSRVDNIIVIIDFDKITEVSEHFCAEYMKYLLTTKNKVITINQGINVSNTFASYVLNNIELQELE